MSTFLCRSVLPRALSRKSSPGREVVAPTKAALLIRSSSRHLRVDPSRLVAGLTEEKVKNDPALKEYLRANFPEAFEDNEKGAVSSAAELNAAYDDAEESLLPAFHKESKPVYPLNIRPLTCYLRNPSRRSQRLREEDKMIPGILYGGDASQKIFAHQPESKLLVKTPWNLIQAELQRYHRHFESRVYNLTLLESPDDDTGGTVHRVLPRDVQRHPIQHSVYCVNYCRYHPGRPIKIPIVYINEEESNVLKHDGFVLPIQRFVECFVEDGVDIPERIELECAGLKFKEVIRKDRLILPDGVRFSDRVNRRGDEYIVGVVFGKGQGADGDGGEEEDGSTAEPAP